MTSPLADTISDAVRNSSDRNTYFITNAIDWPVEGNSRQFAVEMDVGATLSNWLNIDPAHDLVLGRVQDNDGEQRRPNVVIGFVNRFTSPEGRCTLPVENIPSHYKVDLSIHHNPKGLLQDNALIVNRDMTLQYYLRGEDGTRTVPIHATGEARIPRFLTQPGRVQNLKAVLSFLLDQNARGRSCLGIQAKIK